MNTWMLTVSVRYVLTRVLKALGSDENNTHVRGSSSHSPSASVDMSLHSATCQNKVIILRIQGAGSILASVWDYGPALSQWPLFIQYALDRLVYM